MSEIKTYPFNSSQDVVNLQTKYTLFKRVENILFCLSFEGGFDRNLMTEAINALFERHDCLRTRFIKKDGIIQQYFEEKRSLDKIPSLSFSTWAERDAFYKKFRRSKADCFKGDVLRAVYVLNPDGTEGVIFKISHYVADTYGVSLLVSDLCAVYEALKNGGEMPAAPGSFEKVIAKDIEYKNNKEQTEKDAEFFKNYYEVLHPEAPMYCGIHGFKSDEWLKRKKKGAFAMPYYFVKCDTEGSVIDIPSSVVEKASAWCEQNGITMSSFFFYCFSLATSLLNGKARYQTPLMLLDCRGTLSERKAAGTKVIPLSVYTAIDYEKSFEENARNAFEEQQELYRHTKLTYLEVEAIQHKLWGHSMLSSAYSFCYSFIPMQAAPGVHMQILSNGKSSLTTYVALMYDVSANVIHVAYDYQTMLISPVMLTDFHNSFVNVIEKVTANPKSSLNTLFK